MGTAQIMQHPEETDKISGEDINTFRQRLLAWYDENARVLPWRARGGLRADPYHVWLSEIMLQQTVVAAVIPYFLKFLEKWPAVHDLAAADSAEIMQAWAGLGYYARARNMHKCAQIVATERDGIFPNTQEELKKLPGIGDYTSAAIMAIAFDRPATVIDGNVDRVIARYFALETPLPEGKAAIRVQAGHLSGGRADRPGDFAQAMMDLGATVCTPSSPRCALCPVQTGCAGYSKGIQQALPYKRKKAEKPQKYGYVYWIENEKGEVLLERRKEKGLLGGMLGLPCSAWLEDRAQLRHAGWHAGLAFHEGRVASIKHSFTHFDLELESKTAHLGKAALPEDGWQWVDRKHIKNTGLPTLFKKMVTLMVYG